MGNVNAELQKRYKCFIISASGLCTEADGSTRTQPGSEVIMNNIRDFRERMLTCRPQEWEQIPDIDLYMDQVISYMERQHIGLGPEGDESLTPAMINNYIKSGLLPRAKGKRYSREHIGYLTAICLLKQVLSVGETGSLLKNQMEHCRIEDFYRNYVSTLDEVFRETAEPIDEDADEEKMAQLALEMAISAYARILACREILQAIAPPESADKEKKEK